MKKDKKLNPNKYHKKKSDPGIPNSAPFKAAILAERAQILEKKAQLQQMKDMYAKTARQKLKNASVDAKRKRPLESMVYMSFDELTNPAKKGRFDETNGDGEAMDINENDESGRRKAQSAALSALALEQNAEWKSAYLRCKEQDEEEGNSKAWRNGHVNYAAVRKVVGRSDVILHVLDARDPQGTRCEAIEKQVRATAGKKLVYVLNKADLVPQANLQSWLNFLRNEAPTVAFKAAVQRKNRLVKSVHKMKLGKTGELAKTPMSIGANPLLELLKNYARSTKFSGLTVGVVGLPNVGKSSLLNSMKRKLSCEVSSTPGSTRELREVKLDKKLFLIDCPGVVYPSRDMNEVEAALKNVISTKDVRDPETAAMEIYSRSDKPTLCTFYFLRSCETFEEFLVKIAEKLQSVKISGIIDREAASRRILSDWNRGVLKHYTVPPKRDTGVVPRTTIVQTTEDKEYLHDECFISTEENFLKTLGNAMPSQSMPTCGTNQVTQIEHLKIDVSDHEEEGMSDEEGDVKEAGSDAEDVEDGDSEDDYEDVEGEDGDESIEIDEDADTSIDDADQSIESEGE